VFTNVFDVLRLFTSRLLSVGTDIRMESPPQLVETIRNRVLEVARLYH
jgi:hypothetical protein